MQIQLRQDARTNIPTAISLNRNTTLDGRATRQDHPDLVSDRLIVCIYNTKQVAGFTAFTKTKVTKNQM